MEKIDEILQYVKGIDARIDRIEARIDRIEARLDRIEDRLDKIELRLDRLERDRDDMRKEMVNMFDYMKAQTVVLHEMIIQNADFNKKLEISRHDQKQQDHRIYSLEIASRAFIPA